MHLPMNCGMIGKQRTGAVARWALAVGLALLAACAAPAQSNGVLREVFANLSGSALSMMVLTATYDYRRSPRAAA